MEELNFKLETYEGPLDLLLALIAKNKIDIYDIPIALILDQYLEHIEQMKAMNMDVAGEFIIMAAELMLIKSKMMLPKSPIDEDDEDPRARLTAALIEHQRAKEAAGILSQNYDIFSGRFSKPADESPYESIPELKDQDCTLLEQAFIRIVERSKKLKSILSSPEKTLENLLKRRVTPIPEKIFGIMRILYTEGDTSFESILLRCDNRSDIVASFMGLLELMKVGRVTTLVDEEDNLIFHLNRKV